jgi:ABC-2 type transport system permease protein
MQTLRQTTTTPAYSQPDKQPVMVYNKLLYNPQMKSAYNFVPGVMGLILMLICAMMTSISIVREKETGTMEVLLVSPVNPLFIILSKAVPYFVLSLLNLTTILLLSVFVLDVPIAGSLPALLVSAMVLMIPTIILSGIIFPIESMPGILQVLSCLIPARWYVETVRRLMIEGVPLVYVWKEVAVMCLMAVVLITATARKFKNRLE